MNKIKDMLTGHHAEKSATSGTTSGTTDGLDIAQSEGQKAYESGNPAYAGRSGTGVTGTNTSSGLGGSSSGLGSSTSGYDNTSSSGLGGSSSGLGSNNGYQNVSTSGLSSGAERESLQGTSGISGPGLNSGSRGNQYNDTIGSTGATSGSNFASNDPTSSSGYSGNNSSTLGDAGSAGLGASSGYGSSSGLGASSGLPDRSSGLGRHAEHDVAAYQSTEHGIGGPHKTFTANRLDPNATEELSTFHEEHVHGSGVEHGRQGLSTEQYANEHYNPNQGPDFVGGLAGSSSTGTGSSGLGRDAAIGGAGLGAAEGLEHHHHKHHNQSSGLGSSNTGYDNTSSTSGLGSSNTGYDNTTGSSGQSHLGRDAAIGGAGLGAAGLESRHHNQSSGLGSSNTGYDNNSSSGLGSSNTGYGDSGGSGVQDAVRSAVGGEHFGEQDPSHMNYRNGPGYGNGGKADTFSSSSGTGNTGNNLSSHNDRHLGRDAGLGAAGAGALGAAEYEHNKPSATQRFDQGSTTGSSTDNTGPHFNHGHFQSRVDDANHPNDGKTGTYAEGVTGGSSSGSGDHTGPHFSHGHFQSRVDEANHPRDGKTGTYAETAEPIGMSKHEIKEHEKHEHQRGGGLLHSHNDSKLQDQYAGRTDQRDADINPTHDRHTGRDAALGAGVGAGAVGLAESGHHGSGIGQSDYASQPAGGNFSSPSGTAVGSSNNFSRPTGSSDPYSSTSNQGLGSSSTGSNVFGSNYRTDGPHHYGESAYTHNNQKSSSLNPFANTTGQQTTSQQSSSLNPFSKDGSSSKRRAGYGNSSRSAADSEAYDPSNPNYGSSSAIGTTDGYAQRGSQLDSDPTSGLAGTSVGTGNNTYSSGPSYADQSADNLQSSGHKSGGLSGLLHRDHPNKLHKEPQGGYGDRV